MCMPPLQEQLLVSAMLRRIRIGLYQQDVAYIPINYSQHDSKGRVIGWINLLGRFMNIDTSILGGYVKDDKV